MTNTNRNQVCQISRQRGYALIHEKAALTRIPQPQSNSSRSYCSPSSGTSLLLTSGYTQDKTSTIGNTGNTISVKIQMNRRIYTTKGGTGSSTAMVTIEVPRPGGQTETLKWNLVIQALGYMDLGSRFEEAELTGVDALTREQKAKILKALARGLLSSNPKVIQDEDPTTVAHLTELARSEDYADLRSDNLGETGLDAPSIE